MLSRKPTTSECVLIPIIVQQEIVTCVDKPKTPIGLAEVRIKSRNSRFYTYVYQCVFVLFSPLIYLLFFFLYNPPHTGKDCNLHLCRIGQRSNSACNSQRFPTNFLSRLSLHLSNITFRTSQHRHTHTHCGEVRFNQYCH